MCRAAGCSVRASRLGRNTMEVQGAGYRGLATGGCSGVWQKNYDLIESERVKQIHCCTLIEVFVYIYIYILCNKILCKIRMITFKENHA